jgi:hypothetical protein
MHRLPGQSRTMASLVRRRLPKHPAPFPKAPIISPKAPIISPKAPIIIPKAPIINPSQKIDEETFDWYDPKDWYPVRIGEVFKSRYQVIGKLGYGVTSTVWLCKDIRYFPPSTLLSNLQSLRTHRHQETENNLRHRQSLQIRRCSGAERSRYVWPLRNSRPPIPPQ